MATTEEQKAIYYILRTLRIWGENWLRRELPKATPAVKIAKAKFDAVDDASLSTLLMHGGPTGSFDQTKVVYLRPPPKEDTAVAAIWCRWDYDNQLSIESCGYYFGLWSLQDFFPKVQASDQSHIAFIGYRFETPETGENHNYFHAQPCRSMGKKDDEIESALPISNRMPTWPVAARSGVELLLCLVTAIYGMKGMDELRTAIGEDVSARKNGPLRKAIDNILSLRHVPA